MGTADSHGVFDEFDLLILVLQITLGWMDRAFITREEVPTEDKIVDQVFDYAAIHSQVATIDAKFDVDDTQGLHLASINADGATFMGADLVFVEVGVSAEKIFTDA